ncbi:MAG: dihydropteroate synthase [Bacteroidales bacterium]|nr:dihydropteroate synthase [Bacteroidales bacterium]
MEIERDRIIRVMGIVNLTDDSFFEGSRVLGPDGRPDPGLLLPRIDSMMSEGADILDLGACSTRPGSDSVSEEVEWSRLEPALRLIASERPGLSLSIDTFRPGVVSRAFDVVGPFMVNDVSGGPPSMWRLVGDLGLEYVAMHTRGTPKDMASLTDYEDVVAAVESFFEDVAGVAEANGVRDWILDPGFGFAKTVSQNWRLLDRMAVFKRFGRPVLAGLSRKSFLYRPMGLSPADVLPATCAANLVALRNGADVLRVHDVAAARQTIEVYKSLSIWTEEIS